MIATVPYVEKGTKLLKCIFPALIDLICLEEKLNMKLNETELSQEDMTQLKAHFTQFCKSVQKDNKDMHLAGDDRLMYLLVNTYADVQDEKTRGFCIPSPLYILYQMLTIPEEPQSAAYALLFCRTLLYETFKVF
ncbi:MAG: hypothetical protein LBJ23_04300, partial [Tannerella sp.]|nr:hypothetical protein [Tannerella sp.]